MRTGAAISVAAHVAALTAWLLLAGVRPFEPTTAEAITIDIVTPEEAPPLPKEPDYSFPTLDEKAQENSQEKSQEQAAQQQDSAQQQPAEPPAPAAKPKQDTKQAALQQQQPAEQPKPAPPQQQPQAQPQQQAQPQMPPPAQPQQDVPTAAPDITSQFGMMFTLPDAGAAGNFDAKATAKANISREDAVALRAHLKTCSTLPRSVSPTDNVSVVLRVAFRRDGTLAAEPILIEASASEKGPALMRSAMDALAKCQPYAMLPADRYDQWRMLDLSFAPKDFRGG
ncbi:MAG: cell envelope biogenesis protein TolA [Afipia sp.]|nr:cell envelope biogenesis protein TolA [Afipia sp.]